MSGLITKPSKKLTENILLPCCGTNVLLNSSLTRQLVYLLEQLLNVIFHLFDLPGIGTLTLVVNSKQHIHSLWNHFLDTCLVSWFESHTYICFEQSDVTFIQSFKKESQSHECVCTPTLLSD